MVELLSPFRARGSMLSVDAIVHTKSERSRLLPTMHQRFLSIAILLPAFVFTAGGNIVATAFCPSFGRAHACHEMGRQSDMSHADMTHDMHGITMPDVPMPSEQVARPEWHLLNASVASNRTAYTLEQPLRSCSHCITHSNLPRSALVSREANAVQNSTYIDEPDVVTNIFSVVLTPRVINAREHAPPAESSPLHVRLNVFRI
jgi:hypothetical protein